MHITNLDLMQLMLQNGLRIKNIILTDSEISLFQLVKKQQEMSTNDLFLQSGKTTIQNAHGRLDRLFKKGYLNRTSRPQHSGGFEYVYSTKF